MPNPLKGARLDRPAPVVVVHEGDLGYSFARGPFIYWTISHSEKTAVYRIAKDAIDPNSTIHCGAPSTRIDASTDATSLHEDAAMVGAEAGASDARPDSFADAGVDAGHRKQEEADDNPDEQEPARSSAKLTDAGNMPASTRKVTIEACAFRPPNGVSPHENIAGSAAVIGLAFARWRRRRSRH